MPAIHATHPTRRTASAPFLFTSMRSVRRATAALIAGLGLLAGGGAVAQAGSGTPPLCWATVRGAWVFRA